MRGFLDTWTRIFFLTTKALIFLYLLRMSVDWLEMRYGENYELFIIAGGAMAAILVFTDKRQGGQG